MLRIAITGGIACGKSAFAAILESMGIATSDADVMAHSIMEPGTAVYDRILAKFGSGVLDCTGKVNRLALGKIVFGDPRMLEDLNAIAHPAVAEEWSRWLIAAEGRGKPEAAVMVPLLFEAGFKSGWDAIVCVCVRRSIQEHRLCARGLCIKDARIRIDSQMPLLKKMALSDYVVVNDGTVDLLRQQAELVIERIRNKNKR